MKIHLALPCALLLLLLLTAFSTGSVLMYMLFFLVLLCILAGFAAVIWAGATMEVSAELSENAVYRGDTAFIVISLRHRGWIPIAPVLLELASDSGRDVRLRDIPGKTQRLKLPVFAGHVGVFPAGVRACAVEDLLGLFRKRIVLDDASCMMTVFPRTFDTDPLVMAPGDPGTELMSRATEDVSSPSDIREYQPGDAMKKIHWKLSLRKGELMVRKFDEPVLQDILILLDCSSPPSWGHPRAEADIRDALLETAASVFSDQAGTDHSVRMPLLGDHPVDIEKSMGVPIAFDYLARVDFSGSDRFERVLLMESAHMRKVGCVVVIAARLNSAMVDIMIRVHRTGPNLRLYLITFTPEDPNIIPLAGRLRSSGIEVCFSIPDTGGPVPGGDEEGGGDDA